MNGELLFSLGLVVGVFIAWVFLLLWMRLCDFVGNKISNYRINKQIKKWNKLEVKRMREVYKRSEKIAKEIDEDIFRKRVE